MESCFGGGGGGEDICLPENEIVHAWYKTETIKYYGNNVLGVFGTYISNELTYQTYHG